MADWRERVNRQGVLGYLFVLPGVVPLLLSRAL